MANDYETGTGLLYPLRLEHDDFAHGEGIPLLKCNVRKAIATRAASADGLFRGEYPWRGDFGSQVDRLRHSNLDAGAKDDVTRIYVTDAVSQWEPRATVATERVGVTESTNGRATQISVRFKPNTTQAENLVSTEEIAEVDVG